MCEPWIIANGVNASAEVLARDMTPILSGIKHHELPLIAGDEQIPSLLVHGHTARCATAVTPLRHDRAGRDVNDRRHSNLGLIRVRVPARLVYQEGLGSVGN